MNNIASLRKNILFYLIENSASETEIYRDFRKYHRTVVKHALQALERDGDIRRHEYGKEVIYAAVMEEGEVK